MRSPFKIAAPWIPCLRFYVDFVGASDVGGRSHTRKSRLREFTLSLGAFNLRIQALGRLLSIEKLSLVVRQYFPRISAHRYWRRCVTGSRRLTIRQLNLSPMRQQKHRVFVLSQRGE